MNCRAFHKRLVEMLDAPGGSPPSAELGEHAKSCPRCARDLSKARRALEALRPFHTITASAGFKERVMNQIIEMDHTAARTAARRKWTSRLWRPALALAAVVAAFTLFDWISGRNEKPTPGFSGTALAADGFAVMTQAAKQLDGLKSLHIQLRMRTIACDNFELIGLEYDFVPIDIWKEFSTPPRWRIEKSGRVIVMDGASMFMLIRPNYAVKGGPNAGFIEWLRPLLNPQTILQSEIERARKEGAELLMTREKRPDGGEETVVTIEAKAQGDYTNDWLKNKAIGDSDHLRVYRFDAQTGQLRGLQVFVYAKKGDVLVLETTEIEYDGAIDPSLFALELPKDVVWDKQPEVIENNDAYARMKPEEAARAFFQACADRNWEKYLKFVSMSAVPQETKDHLGGLEIVSIGEPFKSGRYRGWFVPYEIRLSNGGVEKYNMAVRNDNPAKRWQVDGGI